MKAGGETYICTTWMQLNLDIIARQQSLRNSREKKSIRGSRLRKS